MFERFTKRARRVVILAQGEARRLGDDGVGTEHLLLALTTEEGGIAATVLRELGATPEAVERALEDTHGRGGLGDDDAEALAAIGIDLNEIRRRAEASFGPDALKAPRGATRRRHIPFSRGAKRTLKNALSEALGLRHNYLGTEHILLGLLAERDDLGFKVLSSVGVVPEAVRDGVLTELRRAS
jgi:ATP-dependent Clp protease ATP-binding subunit ClpA